MSNNASIFTCGHSLSMFVDSLNSIEEKFLTIGTFKSRLEYTVLAEKSRWEVSIGNVAKTSLFCPSKFTRDLSTCPQINSRTVIRDAHPQALCR